MPARKMHLHDEDYQGPFCGLDRRYADTVSEFDRVTCIKCQSKFMVVRGHGRVGIYFKKPLSDGQKAGLRLKYVGVHLSPDGFNYRYREA